MTFLTTWQDIERDIRQDHRRAVLLGKPLGTQHRVGDQHAVCRRDNAIFVDTSGNGHR